MSDDCTTSTPLLSAPAGAASISVTSAGAYAYGSWVEFIAASSAPIHAAGVMLGAGTNTTIKWVEVEIGVGAAGAEVTMVRDQMYIASSGGSTRSRLLEAPVYLGGVGTRVAIRQRNDGTAMIGWAMSLLYYASLSSEHVTDRLLTAVPTGAVGALVTTPASLWAWSPWVELTAGIANEIAMSGLVVTNTGAAADMEWEIGIGAAGAEVGVTRVRAPTSGTSTGSMRVFRLVAAHPIAPSTRIAARVRRGHATSTTLRVQLRYFNDTAFL